MLRLASCHHPRNKRIPLWNPSFIDSVYGWFDISDINTLFQDKEMTIPVTADGDEIKAIANKIPGGPPAILGSNVSDTPAEGFPKYRAARVKGMGQIENFFGGGGSDATYFDVDGIGDVDDSFYFGIVNERKVEGLTENQYWQLVGTFPAGTELSLSGTSSAGGFYPWINSYGQQGTFSTPFPSHFVGEHAVISWWGIKETIGAEFSKYQTGEEDIISVRSTIHTLMDHPINTLHIMGEPSRSSGYTGEIIAAKLINKEEKDLLDNYLKNKWT